MPAFGGSLFALADPFWMILVMESLGSGYRVWDQAGEVEFVAPKRGAVIAEFRVEDAVLDKRREAAADGSNVLRWFDTEIRSLDGEPVARVRKRLYVRLRQAAASPA